MSEDDLTGAAHWRDLAARDQQETRVRRVDRFIDDEDVDLDDNESEDAVYELGHRGFDGGWLSDDYQAGDRRR